MLWIAIDFPHLADSDTSTGELDNLAAWAGRFTPSVSLESGRGLLLEVSGSLKLHGGLPPMVRRMRADLHDMAYGAHLAGAPTARAAWWLARSGRSRFLTDIEPLAKALSPLPLGVLDCDDKTMALLRRLGLRTLGEIWRLPRDGLARRCDRNVLDQCDRALGKQVEPRRFHEPPPHFCARQALATEVDRAEPLLHIARRLLLQLSGYLAGRAAGVGSFELSLRHRSIQSHTVIHIGLVTPNRDAAHLLALLRERLMRTALHQPVDEVCLRADDIRVLAGENATLFDDEISATQAWPQLVEQLRARIGPDGVHGIAVAADHRPEYASVVCDIGKTHMAVARFGLRPLWLLPVPQALSEAGGVPQFEGPLKLLAGPERIQSGWWDDDQARDYFIAQTQSQALLWVYRLPARAWYLHGRFA